MRKTILTFLGLMLSTGIGMAVSSSEDIISQLFTENDVSTSLSTDADELEGLSNGEDPFKNLYLFMYQNVKLAPKEEAIKVLAENADYVWYSEESLAAVVDGDISPLKEELGSGAAQSVLIETYTKIQNDYNNELQLQVDNRGLLYEALAKEIFYNNDLTDSASVDILYDLDLIHYLLFNEYVTYPDRSGDTSTELASEDATIFEKPKLAKVKRSSESSSAASAALSEIICDIDTELSDAITAYEEANPEPEEEGEENVDENTDEGGDDNVDPPTEDDSDEDVPPADDEDSDGDDDAEAPKEEVTVDDFVASLGGGTLGNWERELPCDEIFCITVELIEGDAGVSTEEDSVGYEQTDDCISCHINFIKQKLEETLSKPLAPSKVPMNNFEDGTCKEAGNKINLDINVYTIKKPIFTPENDTSFDSTSDNVEDLKQVLYSSRALTTPDTVVGTTQNDVEAARILNTRAGLDQADVLKQILVANETRMAAIKKTIDDFELSARGQTSQDFEDQILVELATFKSYFSQFQESLKSTLAPLESLAGKKYCE